jgi:hypothetical protein
MKSILQNTGAQNIAVFGPGQNPAGSDQVVNAQGLNQVIQPGVDIYPAFNPSSILADAAPGSISISTFDKNFKPANVQMFAPEHSAQHLKLSHCPDRLRWLKGNPSYGLVRHQRRRSR